MAINHHIKKDQRIYTEDSVDAKSVEDGAVASPSTLHSVHLSTGIVHDESQLRSPLSNVQK